MVQLTAPATIRTSYIDTIVDVAALSDMFGHNFQDKERLREAVCHRGFVHAPREGNRRLAMVGDAVLKQEVVMEWYMDGKIPCGYGTQVISAVISNNNLNGIGQRIGLGAHIRMNKGALGYVSEVMMATALEAVLGAIWLEGGSEAVRPSLRKLGLLRAVASTTEEGLSMPASMPDIFQTKLSLIDNVDEEHVPEL